MCKYPRPLESRIANHYIGQKELFLKLVAQPETDKEISVKGKPVQTTGKVIFEHMNSSEKECLGSLN